MANEITITNSQTLTVSVQPVDANGIPVGAPITQEFTFSIVPGAAQTMPLQLDEEPEVKKRKVKKLEEVKIQEVNRPRQLRLEEAHGKQSVAIQPNEKRL